MSEQPKIPKFRVSAAFVSPAALCLVAGTIWFFSMERASEEEVEATVKKEFPQVVRTSHEVDDRMKEFFRRINSNDPREEERMRNLLNKGKGSNYDAKRHHATSKDIEAFGFVPESSMPKAAAPTTGSASSGASTVATRAQGSTSESSRSGARLKAPEGEGRGEERKTGRKWWFW